MMSSMEWNNLGHMCLHTVCLTVSPWQLAKKTNCLDSEVSKCWTEVRQRQIYVYIYISCIMYLTTLLGVHLSLEIKCLAILPFHSEEWSEKVGNCHNSGCLPRWLCLQINGVPAQWTYCHTIWNMTHVWSFLRALRMGWHDDMIHRRNCQSICSPGTLRGWRGAVGGAAGGEGL